jgi:hypothetical protein
MNSRFMAERKARIEAESAKLAIEESVLGMLPDALPVCPVISNLKASPEPTEPHGWLSFGCPSYGNERDAYSPVGILKTLEDAGWQLLPATLCRWDSYRPSACMGLQRDIPDTKGRYKLTETWPIAPLWFRPCQHTCQEAALYMQAPDGRKFFIHVDTPNVRVSVHARRVEHLGGWYYERGSARTGYPPQWESHPACKIGTVQQSVDTEQGLSGAVFFEPREDHGAWSLPASEFLQSLIDLQNAKALTA